MRPTEILSAEHRVIELVLECLERMADLARERNQLDIESAESALRFLRTFADTCHHGKEEQHLYAAMGLRGMPANVGPIAVMLADHDSGRALIAELGVALLSAKSAHPTAPERFARAAHRYAELMRDHIEKEDQILFPMAESMLTPEDKQRVLDEFGRLEQRHGPDTHRDMEALARSLATRFGVELSAQGAPSATGGCCHPAPARTTHSASNCGGIRTRP